MKKHCLVNGEIMIDDEVVTYHEVSVNQRADWMLICSCGERWANSVGGKQLAEAHELAKASE